MKILSTLILFAMSATAQAQEAPVFQIRSAIGASHYLHGDLGYTAPTWLVSVRAGRRAFAIEPEFAVAWHESTDTFGVNTSTRSSIRFQSFGVNAIARGVSRVSVYGGGGVGFYAEHDRYRLNDPVFGYEQSTTRGPRLGAQALAGVDVPVMSRITAFGQFRYEMRSFEDPGGGSVVQGFGGIAFAIR
jgi:opacity protein-like surface antigen